MCFEQAMQAGYRKLDQSVFGKVLIDAVDAQRSRQAVDL
jgi:hypothetical protein